MFGMLPRLPEPAVFQNFESDSLNEMPLDLETLRSEMKAFLQELGMPVFYGHSDDTDMPGAVYWDTEARSDFREFIAVARSAGAKLIVFNQQTFSSDQIDEALEELDDLDFTREEKRQYENRLRELQRYEGFTCSLELSFALDGRVYMFALQTDWYEALNDMLAELGAVAAQESDDGDGSMPGYFSKN